MKLRVSSLFALILLSLGLVVLVSPAPPAWACSCAYSGKEQDARADLIVTGTVTEVSRSAIQLAVESVEKGTGAAGTLRLKAYPGEASCGYDFRAGQRYRVNSVDGGTGLCVGVQPLPAAASATPALAAPGRPAPGGPAPDGNTGGWWLAAGITVVALAAGAGIAARRRAG
ncbi:hypothetical protein DMB66_03215 [Actinoplanes sp. ATCC 53533]|uniref:hypothetical protein n=1 Tax=Actinoplanes sp. ATCC 53533 TaxID=1288362 RepID=UPI000F7B2706|nr:hypothetical protein [Actinoplanes sp. ATCC 53533]RSM73073.1 hypothetical protein DMB66_03215 [Actinoplanes sp. ATCC 53533]